MRTFVCTTGGSNKFWNIELTGKSYTTHSGKVGSKGRRNTREFPNTAQANREHDRAIVKKVAEGFVETTNNEAPAPLPRLEGSPMREALEAALVEHFDDLASHMAYADFLAEQGDSGLTAHAELIRVQLALEDANKPVEERTRLREQEEKLLQGQVRSWLFDLMASITPLDQGRWVVRSSELIMSFRFVRGWLELVHVPTLNQSLVQRLKRYPLARLLRRLFIDHPYECPCDDLADAPFVGNLRHFVLGTRDAEQATRFGEGTIAVIENMYRLEELETYTGDMDLETLFDLELPNLRALTVFHQDGYPLEVLADNPNMIRLEKLDCWPHAVSLDDFYDAGGDEPAASIGAADMRALMQSPHLKRLQHINLRQSDMGDQGIREVIHSGALKHLKILELSPGCVTDEGARALAATPDARNLEHLDLSRNWLTRAGIRALQQAGIRVTAADQQPEGSYVFLMEGDIE
jgi:uncharacterized protein (TIGR02996 family)